MHNIICTCNSYHMKSYIIRKQFCHKFGKTFHRTKQQNIIHKTSVFWDKSKHDSVIHVKCALPVNTAWTRFLSCLPAKKLHNPGQDEKIVNKYILNPNKSKAMSPSLYQKGWLFNNLLRYRIQYKIWKENGFWLRPKKITAFSPLHM